MPRIPLMIAGPTGNSKIEQINPQRSINLYPQPYSEGARAPMVMKSTPGLTLHKTLSTRPIIGNGAWFDDSMFWATDTEWWQLEDDGTATDRAHPSYAPVDRITQRAGSTDAANLTTLAMADGAAISTYEETAGSANLWTTGFPVGMSYMDGYFVSINADRTLEKDEQQRIWVSQFNDPTNQITSWGGFVSANTYPDVAVNVIAVNRRVFGFCDTSCDLFYNAGIAGDIFTKDPAGVVEVGLAARHSLAELDGRLFLLGQSRGGSVAPYMVEGIEFQKIADTDITAAMQDHDDYASSYGFAYREDANNFYCLTFPVSGITYVYHVETGFWHERSSNGQEWLPTGHVYYKRENYFGDASGNIYKLDRSVATENGTAVRRVRRTGVVGYQNQRIRISSVELELQPGVGEVTGVTDPQVRMRYSKDGGKTFSDWLARSMGKIGEYFTRARWNQLGVGQNFVFEFECTDPVAVTFFNAYANVTVLDNYG